MKRIGILTGGGDVPPLNAVIAAARMACIERGVELFGFIKGWQGVIEKEYVDLTNIFIDQALGGTILKSSRVKLDRTPNGIERAIHNVRTLNLHGLIVVGGEDTISNSLYLSGIPQVLVSKTIDNDVGIIDGNGIVNYFTLGHPTAARKISSFISLREGLRTTAYSHERIIVVESMGMHAGWLALSSGMGHPDFVIIPEFPLDYGRFVDIVAEKYMEQSHVIIVIAEGTKLKDGSYLSADDHEMDDFGHPRFKGAAEILAGRLKMDLRENFNTRDVNAVNPSYLYRSGAPCDIDFQMAIRLGRDSVRLLTEGLDVSVFLTIQKDVDGFSVSPYDLIKEKTIEDLHRFVDERFYNPATYSMTEQGRQYLSAMVQEIPMEPYGIRMP